MAAFIGAAARAKAARKHLETAQSLEARWRALSPTEREALKSEITAVTAAASEVQQAVTFGVRGFVHEFKAAKDGKDAAPMERARPLTKSVPDLVRASIALRAALDRPPAAPG
jgi:hypothetical protein